MSCKLSDVAVMMLCCVFQVGVKHLVVYINKADAVDDTEVLELVS